MTAASKDEGIAAVRESHIVWFTAALHDWVAFVRSRKQATAEEWRAAWFERGMPQPKSPNVWGAVVHHAQHSGLVRHTGRYVPARSPATHSHPVAVWTSAAPQA